MFIGLCATSRDSAQDRRRGLSRRRSRVRVPSLPSFEVPANRHFCCPIRRAIAARGPIPWPKRRERTACKTPISVLGLVAGRTNEHSSRPPSPQSPLSRREQQRGAGVAPARATASRGDLHSTPLDATADILRRLRELALDRLSALPEVLPAFVVDWNSGARVDEAAHLDGAAGRHRVAQGSRDRELHAPEMQERGVDLKAVGTWRTPSKRTVSPEIHSTPCS
jgi:hypothetical protein